MPHTLSHSSGTSASSMPQCDSAIELYLDLMKKSLTQYLYGDIEDIEVKPRRLLSRLLVHILRRRNMFVKTPRPFDPETRINGLDWPPTACTMIGFKRLDNIKYCIEQVIANEVPGDFIETGVWRGGATIFMRAVLKAHNIADRIVWAADSFAGLPTPNVEQYPEDAGDKHHTMTELAISLEDVKRNFARYGLLDEQVQFLRGWFRDTLPTAPMQNLALMRLDGDMYESTLDALTHLYPKLSVGGYVIIDDYGYIESCRKAVHDYRTTHHIADTLHSIDWSGVYWQKTA